MATLKTFEPEHSLEGLSSDTVFSAAFVKQLLGGGTSPCLRMLQLSFYCSPIRHKSANSLLNTVSGKSYIKKIKIIIKHPQALLDLSLQCIDIN